MHLGCWWEADEPYDKHRSGVQAPQFSDIPQLGSAADQEGSGCSGAENYPYDASESHPALTGVRYGHPGTEDEPQGLRLARRLLRHGGSHW